MTVASSSRWSRQIGFVAAALVLGLSACSLSSLDGLKNGRAQAGAGQTQPAEQTNGTVPVEIGSGGVGAAGSGAGSSAGGAGGSGGATVAAGGSGGMTADTGAGSLGKTGGLVGGQVAGGAITSEKPGSGGIGGGPPLGGTRGSSVPNSHSSNPSSSRCAGVDDQGICWYLGAAGDSCVTTCATHGGNSPQAASHVGISSQGGSAGECGRLLGLLGQPGSVYPATRADAEGLGCIVALGYHVWLTAPAYNDNAKYAGVQNVCGCLE